LSLLQNVNRKQDFFEKGIKKARSGRPLPTKDGLSKTPVNAQMNTTQDSLIMQRWTLRCKKTKGFADFR
jgi:hypothetical protein